MLSVHRVHRFFRHAAAAVLATASLAVAAEAAPLTSGTWTVQDRPHENASYGEGAFFIRTDSGNPLYLPWLVDTANGGVTFEYDADAGANGIIRIFGSMIHTGTNQSYSFSVTYDALVADPDNNRILARDVDRVGQFEGVPRYGQLNNDDNASLVVNYDPDTFNLTLVDGWLWKGPNATRTFGDWHFLATRNSPPPPSSSAVSAPGAASLMLVGLAAAFRRYRRGAVVNSTTV